MSVSGIVVMVGVFAMALGVAIVLWGKRRAFRRRNAAGVEIFSGFFAMLGARFVDRAAVAVGALTIMGGVGIVATTIPW